MSLLTKCLSISLLPLFLSLIPLLQFKALALDKTSSLSLVNNINVACNETDFHALLALKSNILLEYQQALRSWNGSLHFCHWDGVQCSRQHERVTAIDLTSRGLVGSLSPYIGNLSFLRELSLGNNTFTGAIPTELGSLFRLEKLSLTFNGFEGKIPTSLSRCSNLKYLSLTENKLVGEFPKELGSSMPRLVTLYFSKNNLTGGIPPSFGNLTSLLNLSASFNPLGGSIPNDLGRLKNLRHLWLGHTEISGTIPPSLYNLSLLESLSVSYNRLQGSLPQTFGFMFPHMQILQLNRNQFNGPLPLSISNSSKLLQLMLGFNNFNGKVTNDFGSLTNLREITLDMNNFEAKGSNGLAFLSSLTNCSNLRVVSMGKCQFGGVLPDSVGNLSLSLFWLLLGGNKLHGSIPSTIGNLVNLEHLGLNENLFTGPIPDSVGYLHKLRRLIFSTNTISGKIPDSIGNLSFLNQLYLWENRLEGAIPASLGNCRNLLTVALTDNNLSGTIPRQLLMVSSLSIGLYLNRNRLSGSLPLEVGNLKNLVLIDISENGLSGEIPQSLGSCSSLENLYMQHNFFQGSIPSSMESLRGIQNLDLSGNNLSGQIPIFLGTFTLKSLNLSFNNFEGELPMKGVFTNASAISVAGNYRLCGGISALRLPQCITKKSRNTKFLSWTLGIAVATILVGVTVVSSFVIRSFKKKRKTKPTVSLLKDPFLKVSYGELLKATEGFSSANLLGFGSFGHVYKGIIEQNRELVVAVKVLDLQTRGATKSFMAECEALRNIRHRNLVSIITSCSSTDFQGNEFKALVYEFMPNGSLDNWLHPIPSSNCHAGREFVGLNLLQRIDIAIDVACALDYLHHHCGRPIIHCDLKPGNILLDGDMVAHVGDFGLARFRAEFTTPSTSSSTAIRGTIGYAAPEYGLGSEMSISGDIYSYGILLLEMISRKRPTDIMFEGDLNLHNFTRIALPQRVMEIVDPMLLTEERNGSKMMEYLISVIEIGLACSTEFPKDRMSIDVVLRELHLVKNNILKTDMDS
ncbi:probable LRR receptor-like serine/threonine-protein kinase At3g47570 isoform X2 [Rhododendron vialii]|uniref:probable LRR receptor-like serine/threonine-protein kinase At3g47570 isoform X2 n=1 Tax=Rhododendron vialii TaxID=182163 RepID=UPI00265D8A3F|nr:probable LRR receptor-like serine/threonine-protein kinase At3g47570 isoform X2 [Rhododendron vialii]